MTFRFSRQPLPGRQTRSAGARIRGPSLHFSGGIGSLAKGLPDYRKYRKFMPTAQDLRKDQTRSVDRPQDLARVHDVVRVERLLDGAHQRHRLAVLLVQKLDLAHADSVLAGAGAAPC